MPTTDPGLRSPARRSRRHRTAAGSPRSTPPLQSAAAVAIVAIVLALVLGACGDEAIDPVDRADRSLRDLQSGEISLALTSVTEGAEPVGLSVEGPFSIRGDAGDLLVGRLRYRQVLGPEPIDSTLISTGDRAWLQTGDTLIPLDVDETESLRLAEDGSGKPAGLGELDLSAWVTNARTDDGPSVDGEDTRRIRGDLDAAAFVAGLAELAADSAGAPGKAGSNDGRSRTSSTAADEDVTAADGDDLQRRVQRSSVEILLAKADDAVRRIEALVRFKGGVPDAVRAALGPYAGAELRFVLEIDRPNKPVKVSAPQR